MKFAELIGQKAVQHNLTGMVKGNRLSHALLFMAKEGTGGLPLALAFAQYLVCEKVNNPSTGPSLFGDAEPVEIPDDACGQCASCTKAADMVHPDIHYSYPVITKKTGDKPISADFITEWRTFVKKQPYANVYDWLQFIGAENKQGNITARECNEIGRKLTLKSFESLNKVLVMWMPEYLDKEGNKLLKIIEEPPPNTIFILVAEEDSKILPTILSRTQLVRIPQLDTPEIERALLKAGAPAESARKAASLSDGNYYEALQMIHHSDNDWEEMIRSWLNAALKTGPAEQVKWSNEVAGLGREKQKQLLRYFNHLLEIAIRLPILGKEQLHVAENEIDFAMRLNKLTNVSQQQAIIKELDEAVYHIERNANPKILFQALTIRLYHIIKNKVVIEIH